MLSTSSESSRSVKSFSFSAVFHSDLFWCVLPFLFFRETIALERSASFLRNARLLPLKMRQINERMKKIQERLEELDLGVSELSAFSFSTPRNLKEAHTNVRMFMNRYYFNFPYRNFVPPQSNSIAKSTELSPAYSHLALIQTLFKRHPSLTLCSRYDVDLYASHDDDLYGHQVFFNAIDLLDLTERLLPHMLRILDSDHVIFYKLYLDTLAVLAKATTVRVFPRDNLPSEFKSLKEFAKEASRWLYVLPWGGGMTDSSRAFTDLFVDAINDLFPLSSQAGSNTRNKPILTYEEFALLLQFMDCFCIEETMNEFLSFTNDFDIPEFRRFLEKTPFAGESDLFKTKMLSTFAIRGVLKESSLDHSTASEFRQFPFTFLTPSSTCPPASVEFKKIGM